MTITAVVLLSLSAFLHVFWNLLSKQHSASSAFFFLANFWGAAILLPAAFLFREYYSNFPWEIWQLVLATGLFQAVYFTFLAAAYREGEISTAYPLIRSAPIVMVALITFLLGQGSPLGLQWFLGAFLVIAGCFLVPLRKMPRLIVVPSSFRPDRPTSTAPPTEKVAPISSEKITGLLQRNLFTPACGFALLAATGTAGYSIIDATALDLLPINHAERFDSIIFPLLYVFLEALATIFWLGCFLLLRKTWRKEFLHSYRHQKRSSLTAGTGIYMTYILVLFAMLWVDNVSYVVGFRQMSIPLGALMGAMVLKEKLYRPKVFGILILLFGLVLIATG